MGEKRGDDFLHGGIVGRGAVEEEALGEEAFLVAAEGVGAEGIVGEDGGKVGAFAEEIFLEEGEVDVGAEGARGGGVGAERRDGAELAEERVGVCEVGGGGLDSR